VLPAAPGRRARLRLDGPPRPTAAKPPVALCPSTSPATRATAAAPVRTRLAGDGDEVRGRAPSTPRPVSGPGSNPEPGCGRHRRLSGPGRTAPTSPTRWPVPTLPASQRPHKFSWRLGGGCVASCRGSGAGGRTGRRSPAARRCPGRYHGTCGPSFLAGYLARGPRPSESERVLWECRLEALSDTHCHIDVGRCRTAVGRVETAITVSSQDHACRLPRTPKRRKLIVKGVEYGGACGRSPWIESACVRARLRRS